MLLTMQEQEDLVSRKLATKKVCGNYVTYKYAKRVMYDYLWQQHPELMECRGHTYNLHTGELVLVPPKKSFNYLELDTWEGVPLDTEVVAYRKYNGFMASARIVDDKLLVATTGTTNQETSQYVGWARCEISKLVDRFGITGYGTPRDYNTTLYEIVIPEDPHIVDDGIIGAIPLLVRSVVGDYFFRGEAWETTLGDVLNAAKTAKHEGWMVYNAEEYSKGVSVPATCKVKTDYYFGKKKLMRMNEKKIEQMFANPHKYIENNLPKSWGWFADIVEDYLVKDSWMFMGEYERRQTIESFEG